MVAGNRGGYGEERVGGGVAVRAGAGGGSGVWAKSKHDEKNAECLS